MYLSNLEHQFESFSDLSMDYFFLGRPGFKYSAMLLNSQLVASGQFGLLIHFVLFGLLVSFFWSSCKLTGKSMICTYTTNKVITIDRLLCVQMFWVSNVER